jgi:uncharacterized protein (TIGR02266 family)
VNIAAGMQDASKRRDPRVGYVLRLRYRNAGHFLVSYCTNLSRGGLFVATPQPAPVGARVELEVDWPGAQGTRTASGVVRWVRGEADADGPAGMGVRFDDLDTTLGSQIDHLVAEVRPVRIALAGDPSQPWEHLAALARSLVNCEVRHDDVAEVVPSELESMDLVVVDVDAMPGAAILLLQRLAAATPRPAALALVAATAVDLRRAAGAFAHVVETPVERDDLQRALLRTLAAVETSAAS